MTFWFPLKDFFRRSSSSSDWPPPAPADADETDDRFSPAAAPVHVMPDSATVRLIESILIVEKAGEPVFERPVELISALHIHGWAHLTGACVSRLTAQGTPIIWRGVSSYPIAMTLPMHSAGLDVRRAQYAEAAGERGLSIARQLVAAKIVNMRGLVRRRASNAGRGSLNTLAVLARKARHAKTRDSLFGIEGSATALYFGAWPQLFADRAGEVQFDGRSRRPPRDMVNAMLSYAYAVLAAECVCALAATGLDPRLGVFHQPRAGRAALALDLMEPFRPIIADQAVLGGLNTGQIKTDSAEEGEGGWRLGEVGKRTLLNLIEKRLASLVADATQLSYREMIGRHAQALAIALSRGETLKILERP